MTKKKNYSKEELDELEWYEHIRLRPAMYIGRINLNGFVTLLKGLFSDSLSQLNADTISFDFRDQYSGRIVINNIKQDVNNYWGVLNSKNPTPYGLELPILNALSSILKIKLLDSNGSPKLIQEYKKGALSSGVLIDKAVACNTLEIDFVLDEEIWGNSFNWLESFINEEIQEFAYLHKNVAFRVSYEVAHEQCKIVYYFKNGLRDRLEMEKLKGLGSSYFDTYIDTSINDFDIEVAFAFRNYTVDAPFLKSFVNDYYTHENGSHVDGLLKGLTYGVMKYFQKYDLTEQYKISEKGMRQNLVGILNIKMKEPIFSGCVKNKLANPEIIEPMAQHISELLFEKIETDKESAEKLIRKFEVPH